MFIAILVICCLNTKSLVEATLVLPIERNTGLACIREGKTVSYECTVTDPLDPPVASTVWLGTAFNCPSASDATNNQITLRHSLYLSGGAAAVCGGLSAMSIEFNGNNYTSRLTLTASNELNGLAVECTLGGTTEVGNDSIKIGVSPPPPIFESAMVAVTSDSSLTVSWSEPSNTTNVGGYVLNVTGEDCGCVNMNVNGSTTSVSCFGWTARGQTCSFEVKTVSLDCGFPSDAAASTFIVLSVPSSPSQLSLGNLQQTCLFETTNAVLSWMAPFAIPGYPLITLYLVTVNNGVIIPTTGTETNISIPGSTFSNAGTYSFSVRAVNALGESAPLLADLHVALTSVSSSDTPTMTNVTLKFSLNNTGCFVSANLIVYYQECSDQMNSNFSSNEQSISATEAQSHVITNLRAGITYCYRSEVVNGGSIVGFENGRMFSTLPPTPPVFEWLIAVIVILVVIVLIVGVIVGVLIILFLVKKYKKTADDEKDITEKTPPPPDSLYTDPNTIEHEAAPGTEDQYAMVDRKVKKNTKPKPTPPEALYQDPSTIEHETAASGDTYAVVDKPKRSSKKKGGPDVVPPASEGLTYADIDLSSKRPKPGSGRQAPQQPGEYPKEHLVEYSSVDHGNTSQL